MKIINLRCDYVHNPLGIDATRPRLFWQLDSDRPGARQAAYRIRAASDAESIENAALWDSGRIESDQSTHVPYGGPELRSRQRVYWQVAVWDESGAQTRSDIAFFEMGLLEREDWQGQWIGGRDAGGAHTTVPAPFLRRAFELPAAVKSARLYATALGVYECEINGQRVGDEIFAPGWTDYNKRVQYQTYDVTELLQAGANVWGAVLGDGWYCGHVEWRGRQRYGDKPKFLGQLEVELARGERFTIATDGSWSQTTGPILEADMLMGESFDARQDFPGWSRPDFLADTEAWRPVQVFQDESLERIELSTPLGPSVVAHETLQPIAMQTFDHWPRAIHILDFGQNLVGRVRLKVRGDRGTTISLRFAETLDGGPAATSGRIYTANLRTATQTDHYTLAGTGEDEIWEPRFTFHGFRFVEVAGWPGTPEPGSITAVVLHSDNPRTGSFECSEPLINQLQSNIDWGWRGNSVDIPTDCPQRDERLGWTGDAQVIVRTACFNRDVAAFFREWARDVADAQSTHGGIPCIVPNTNICAGATSLKHDSCADGGPGWADAVLICPWTIYRCYGDTRILEENYEVFEKFMEYQQDTARDGIRCYDGSEYYTGYGDWLALDGSGKLEGGTPRDLLGTAFFAHDADLMSRIASALGKSEDAERYRALFEEVRSAFQRRFVTSEGLLSPPYQTPYLLALHFGLLPEELRESSTGELVREIKARGNKLSTGFVGSPYLNHVLSSEGRLDVAYELLFQQEWPSWLYAVTQGATTIWERWDGWTHDKGFQEPGMNSFNHYAYGAIGAWLYQVVAGIDLDPEIPGYKKFILRPQPNVSKTGPALTSAQAHLDTLHGRIESSWTLEEGTFTYRFRVPANTSAAVHLPDGQQFEAGPGRHEAIIPMNSVAKAD